MTISLDGAVTETFDNNKLLEVFKNFKSLTRKTVICSKKRCKSFFDEHQTVNQDENVTSDENELMDVGNTIQRSQASNILDNFYTKSVILKGELSSTEMQAVVSNNYVQLQYDFSSF